MVFSSIPFLFFFLPICLVIYYLVPFRWKNGILLFFSLIFYAWGEPIYILLLLAETFLDFVNGLCMEKYGTTQGKRTFFLCCSLVIDLSALSFFKYSDFIVDTFRYLLHINMKNPNISLPIGISFFTFQTMSYVIDLYRGEVKAEHNYFNYLAYVSMFPQLIAGPIVRYAAICEELHARTISWIEIQNGFLRFLKGLFKKVLLANEIGLLWEEIQKLSANELSLGTAWLGAIATSLQIYYDFSGYSDMAIGIGQMLGFHFSENFMHPFSARSISDFWRKWHISLTRWFHDYVYIPLGGNRVKKWKLFRNILIVWMLTGLWHGACWSFVCWGLYFGVLLIIEKQFMQAYLEKIPGFIQRMYVIIFVLIGFVIFSIDDFSALFSYFYAMFGGTGIIFSNDFIWYLQNYGIIIVTACIFAFPVREYLSKRINWKGKTIFVGLGYIILFVLTLSSIVNDSYNPFLYFRF